MKFLTLISFILILAKIFGLITLSWIMCFIPFIIAIGIKLLVLILGIIMLIVAYCLDKNNK